MKNSGVEWIGEIPEDWEVKKVKYIFSERKNKNIGTKEKNLLSLSYGKIVRKNITNMEGLIPESYETYNILQPGDIVFRLTDLQNDKHSLRTGLCKEKGIITSAYTTVIPPKKVDPVYIHYLFHAYDNCKVFYNLGDGVRQGMKYSDLCKLNIILPPKETQQRIASYLDKKCSKIEETIQNQQQVIEKLKAYKQSLITEAVTGKVKIANGKVCGEYESYKDSGVEWLGKIPSEWEVGKTGMFTYVTKLAGFEFTDIMMDKISEKGDVPIVRAQNVRMFKFNKEIINEYIDLLTSNTLNRCCLDKKCLLITFIGAGIGDICIFDESIRYHLAPNVAKIEIRNFAKTKLCEEFLMYYIGSEPGKREIANISKVAAQPSLSMETIRKIKLCIPPFEEQKLIVDYLYPKCLSIDKTIEQKQKLIVKLTEYKKSLIYECVTGKKEI